MKKKLLLITALTVIFIVFSGCGTDWSRLQEQGEFSIGDDVTKYIDTEEFIQQATGAVSAGETYYSSSNEAVATVNESTGVVEILSSGTAFITAYNTGDEYYQPAVDFYELTVIDTKFIAAWATDDDAVIKIPVYDTYDYDYTIDWGDGDIDSGCSRSVTHQYETAGIYTITISGTFPGFYHYYEDSADKAEGEIISIENWGTIEWQSMNSAFIGCSSLVCNAYDIPDLSNVTDMSRMFAGAFSFNSDLSDWDVSGVTDMSDMFLYAYSFNQDLSGWDVSGVTDMSDMFLYAYSFNSDLSDWDVSGVTNMSNMFAAAFSFNSDLSDWDVSGVTNMSSMFSWATDFISDLSNWDVSNVTSMGNMFYYASRFNSDLSDWDVSNVTSMSRMFSNASSFSNNNLSGWVVSNVTSYQDFSENWGSGNTEPTWP